MLNNRRRMISSHGLKSSPRLITFGRYNIFNINRAQAWFNKYGDKHSTSLVQILRNRLHIEWGQTTICDISVHPNLIYIINKSDIERKGVISVSSIPLPFISPSFWSFFLVVSLHICHTNHWKPHDTLCEQSPKLIH